MRRLLEKIRVQFHRSDQSPRSQNQACSLCYSGLLPQVSTKQIKSELLKTLCLKANTFSPVELEYFIRKKGRSSGREEREGWGGAEKKRKLKSGRRKEWGREEEERVKFATFRCRICMALRWLVTRFSRRETLEVVGSYHNCYSISLFHAVLWGHHHLFYSRWSQGFKRAHHWSQVSACKSETEILRISVLMSWMVNWAKG